MKKIASYTLAFALLIGGFPALTKPTQADWGFHISFGFFYNRLRPYGHWVHVPRYGQVWYPVGVGRYWQPYSDGYWAYTEFGWTWVSYDPFGWIPFHYGAWTLLPTYGWVWVPGYVWSPAWVTWRYGPSYVGWAPIPPGYDFYYGNTCPPVTVVNQAWVFVESNHLGSSDIQSDRLPYRENGQYVSGSQPRTNLKFVDDHVVNTGPGGPPGGTNGGGVGGHNGVTDKFNLRQVKLEQLGLQPQPVKGLKKSAPVSVATPYTSKSLPKLDETMLDRAAPAKGYTDRVDRVGSREPLKETPVREKDRSGWTMKDPDRIEPSKTSESPRRALSEKDRSLPADVPRSQPATRSEKPPIQPSVKQPVPRSGFPQKGVDGPKAPTQPRSIERPWSYTVPSSRGESLKPSGSSREKPLDPPASKRNEVKRIEKVPRHVYQSPAKRSTDRPKGPVGTRSASPTAPPKKGKP